MSIFNLILKTALTADGSDAQEVNRKTLWKCPSRPPVTFPLERNSEDLKRLIVVTLFILLPCGRRNKKLKHKHNNKQPFRAIGLLALFWEIVKVTSEI